MFVEFLCVLYKHYTQKAEKNPSISAMHSSQIALNIVTI